MRLFYFHELGRANFGDDLNRWMWPSLIRDQLGTDDGVYLSGIGTIVNASLMPQGKKWIVLGSGAGYGYPPLDFGGDNWQTLSVRGPLSAEVLHLPVESVITDAAILLREIAGMEQAIPEEHRHGIVFMPHYQSISAGAWKKACALARFEYLDPLADSRQSVDRIRHAKLVLADAMHAAIVADTFRVPWIPVVSSTAISTFKWLDWTLSLDVRYRPHRLHPSSSLERLRDATNGLYGEDLHLPQASADAALDHYRSAQKQRIASWWKSWVRVARGAAYTIPAKILRAIESARPSHLDRDEYVERAAESLRLASAASPILSDDRIFEQRRGQMHEALEKIPQCLARLQTTQFAQQRAVPFAPVAT